jgi:enamine deaminase RidA (YjgF/YER057c/UK114 family)
MPAEIIRSNPAAVRAPTGYTHAMEIKGDYRRLVISGQVGVAMDGSVPTSGEGQIAQAFANLRAVLTAHGMGVENIVKTTTFLTDRGLLEGFRSARSVVFGEHLPASTLLFVAGLADPRWVVEIEAEAVA